jgi:hypothetical protein
MDAKLKNITCNCCQAGVQSDQGRLFKLTWRDSVWPFMGFEQVAFICDLCTWPENEPIPFTVTEKGIAESMRQPAKKNENA